MWSILQSCNFLCVCSIFAEYRFIIYPPSVIAAAAACAAIQGMNMQLSNGQNPVVVLQEVTRTDLVYKCRVHVNIPVQTYLRDDYNFRKFYKRARLKSKNPLRVIYH